MTSVVMIATLMVMTVIGADRASAFNLNTTMARVMKGPEGTRFGFSVALWAGRDGGRRLVIGAPRGTNSTAANGSLPLGNVHFCESFTSDCLVDETAPKLSYRDTSAVAVTWSKDFQRQGIGFGETIYTRNSPNSLLVVCAPRYPRKATSTNTLQTRGACYILPKSKGRYKTINPFPNEYHFTTRKNINSNAFTATAHAGTSAALSRDELFLYMGGPYSYYIQGEMIRSRPSGDSGARESKSTYGEQALDFSLEGWAAAVGRFGGGGDSVAASCPASDGLLGSVIFYSKSLGRLKWPVLYGRDFGAKFGYSLGAGDLDGDGADDLLVGAPLAPSRDGLAPDAGKVYVYYSPRRKNAARSTPLTLEGHQPWEHFGLALTSPGDLNQDGYDDVAIGAPGGDGKVYIYNGREDGLHPEPTQVLRASDFSSGLRGFGFSLDGGIDMDGNAHPDLVVGAVDSDAAVFLRSAPVVTLEGFAAFDPPVISLRNKSCTTRGGRTQRVACADLLVSIQYASNEITKLLQMEFEIELDGEQGRLLFLDPELKGPKVKLIHNVSCSRDEINTLRLPVYIKPGQHQNEIPGTASLNVTLVQERPQDVYYVDGSEGERGGSGGAVEAMGVPPVLGFFGSSSFSAEIRMDCEDAFTCFSSPDLILRASAPPRLVIGEAELGLTVELAVRNDTAFGAKLRIDFAPGLRYVRVSGRGSFPRCRSTATAKGNALDCSFVSDLLIGDTVLLTFLFDQMPVRLLNEADGRLAFRLNVSSDSKDLNEADNALDLAVKLVAKVNLFVKARSEPEVAEARANESLALEDITTSEGRAGSSAEQLGPRIRHVFSVTNRGPTPLLAAQIRLKLPQFRSTGLPLYVVEPPRASGPAACTSPPLNPMNLNVPNDRKGEGGTADSGGVGPEDGTGNYARVEREVGRDIASEFRLNSPEATRGTTTTTTTIPGFDGSPSSSSSSSSSSPPLPIVRNDPIEEGNVTEIMQFSCDSKQCQTITCDVMTLLIGDTVTVEVIGYVGVATLQLFKRRVVSLATTLTLDATTQPCVSINDYQEEACDLGVARDDQVTPGDDQAVTENDDQVVTENETGATENDDQAVTENDIQVVTENETGAIENDDQAVTENDDQAVTENDIQVVTENETGATENDDQAVTINDIQVVTENETGATEDDDQAVTENDDPGVTENETGATENDDQAVTENDDPGVAEGDLTTRGGGGGEVVTRPAFTIRAETLVTIIKHNEMSASLRSVEAWKLFIAVIAAIMVIVVVSAILYKVGFFERKRITDDQRKSLRETQKRRTRIENYQAGTAGQELSGGAVFVG